MTSHETELQHWGVLGMKWGVRRNKEQLARARSDKEETQEQHEANKAKAIKSGKASDVLRYKGELTNEELRRAVDRIDLERRLSDLNAKETKTGFDTVMSMMDKVEKTNNAVNKGINMYNTIAKVNNSVSKKRLPVLDGKSPDDKEKESKIDKLIKSGTPEDIAKRFGSFTVKELEEISKRMNYEDSIRKRLASTDK